MADCDLIRHAAMFCIFLESLVRFFLHASPIAVLASVTKHNYEHDATSKQAHLGIGRSGAFNGF